MNFMRLLAREPVDCSMRVSAGAPAAADLPGRGAPWMSMRAARRLDDALPGALGAQLAIEEQRVVGAAPHRPVVEPGVSIRHAPQRDAVQPIRVPREDLED